MGKVSSKCNLILCNLKVTYLTDMLFVVTVAKSHINIKFLQSFSVTFSDHFSVS